MTINSVLDNGAQYCCARFGCEATLYKKLVDLDFAYNEVEIKDMYLGYKFNNHFFVKAGNFKVPMSMERTNNQIMPMASDVPMALELSLTRAALAGTGWGSIGGLPLEYW